MSLDDQLARRCAQALFDRDPASQNLGMHLGEVRAGTAEVTMTVRDDMVNGHGTCHGGYIFSLADSAFAFTCNGANRVNVALNAHIDFLAPARRGDVLTARAEQVQRGGRTARVEIIVRNQTGDDVARFTGRSYQLERAVLEDTESST